MFRLMNVVHFRRFLCLPLTSSYSSASSFSSSTHQQSSNRPILVRKEDFIPSKVSGRTTRLGRNEVSVFASEKHLEREGGKQCATLVILCNLPSQQIGDEQGRPRNDDVLDIETCVLFTHRAPLMRSHANEISIPGGTIEPDESAEAAALREAEEEIGLRQSDLRLWGPLPPVLMRKAQGRILPFVAQFTGDQQTLQSELRAQSDEVQGIFLVPVRELLAGLRFTTFRIPDKSSKDGLPLYYRLPAFVVNDFRVLLPSIHEKYMPTHRLIWGITAVALHEALLALLPNQLLS